MVKVREDLAGQRFGKLIVIKQVEDHILPSGKRCAKWLCLCDCGHYVEICGNDLKRKQDNGGCYYCKAFFNKKYNQYDLSGEYGIGLTSNTNKEFYFDLEDYDRIKDYCWYEAKSSTKYYELRAKQPNSRESIRMHVLLGFKDYDHIDRNTFNNRKCNLRPCTEKENLRNRGLHKTNKSGITGVCWSKQRQVWLAYITVDNNNIYLGGYVNKDDAIRTRLLAEQKYFGEFAPQQHLYEQYGITKQNDLE